MSARRYSSFVSPTAEAPAVEARRMPPSEREPVHVQATTMEHVAVGVAWAGVVGAVGLAVRTVMHGIPDYWPGVGVLVLLTFAVVACYMVTWHYTQDERMRGRDLRAWRELEADYAQCDLERREALADNGRLREQLRIATLPIGRTVAAQPVDEQRLAYIAAAREIARRFELGLPYDREAMVADGALKAALWNQVMADAKRKGVVQAQGKGGRLTIIAYRAEDLLQALEV